MAEFTQPIALVKQSDVEFYGEQLVGALAEDGNIYIPLTQICENLNLDVRSQVLRIRRSEALADGLRLMKITALDGRQREVTSMRVDLVPGWLAGITTSKIGDEALRKKIVTYQRDLYRVAWAVFGPMQASVVPAHDVQAMAQRMAEITHRIEAIDDTIQSLTNLLNELKAAVAETKAVGVIVEGLKSEVGALRTELADLQTRSANAFKIAGDRIKRLELRLNPGMAISEEQAARIKEAVTYVANALQERGKPRAYAEVWASFKQHFAITEYKNLPQGRFGEALEWLSKWGAAVLASPKPLPPPSQES